MTDDTRNNQTAGTSSSESGQSQPAQQPYYRPAQSSATYQQAYQQYAQDAQSQYTEHTKKQKDRADKKEQRAQKRAEKKREKQRAKQQNPNKHSAAKTFGISFAGAAVAVIIGLGCFIGYEHFTSDDSSSASGASGSSSSTTIQVTGDDDTTLAEAVAEKCLPSVVSIDIYEYESSSDLGSYFGFEVPGTNDDDTLTETAMGSGVVISSDGYILTNNHVIEDADVIKATINGTEYDAELVGADSSSDIAVLKVDASDLTAIDIGSSSDVEVGEWVMALGNPFGLENSVSTGVVSALQRSTTLQDESTGETVIYPNLIQTDATINPGNSGGALVNSNGELIGINSMIQSYSGSSSGVGFAIPIDYAMGIAEQIMNGETPTHAQLGVSMVDITSDMAQYYNLATDTGVYVANVYADSAAEAAGIQKGDIITQFDGEEITSSTDLQLAVRSKNPGDTVDVVVNRSGEEMTLSVTLGDDEDTLTSSDDSSDSYGYGYNDDSGSDSYGYDLGDLFGYGY